jgi:hypothetical protein
VPDDWLTGFKRREFEGLRRRYAKTENMYSRNKNGNKKGLRTKKRQMQTTGWRGGWIHR